MHLLIILSILIRNFRVFESQQKMMSIKSEKKTDQNMEDTDINQKFDKEINSINSNFLDNKEIGVEAHEINLSQKTSFQNIAFDEVIVEPEREIDL
jgi:hypothetical protein